MVQDMKSQCNTPRVNEGKKKTHDLLHAEKGFDKIQNPFMTKTLNKLRVETTST